MSAPLVIVNAKTYQSSQGCGAVELARIMDSLDSRGARLILAVSPFDLSTVASEVENIEIWTQHLDPIGFGSNTGRLHPSTAIEHGALGTLINHAENKVDLSHVAELLPIIGQRISVCACAADFDEAKALAALSPDYVAIEPPELIGGDISVTTADPAIVSGTVDLVKSVNPSVKVLCGAGVNSGADVACAIELGASGVLLASAVTMADDPAQVLNDLLSQL
jgi:triosephosphate isomerase